MKIRHVTIMAMAMGAAGAAPAIADPASDLAAIRAQLKSMQQDYNTRLRALEAQMKKTQADAEAAKVAAANAASTNYSVVRNVTQTSSAPPPQVFSAVQTAQLNVPAQDAPSEAPPPDFSAPAAVTPSSSANAFNPSIGVVLNGLFTATSQDPGTQGIRGFSLGDEAGLAPRGFSIGESEVSFAANIDPYLSGNLVVSFDNEGHANVEEGYIATTGLGGGLTIKGGRFLSGIGYLNEHHAHQWSFSDAPLPYRAFLGGQLGDDGVQVKWLAPTNIFLEFGAEWLRGDAFPAANASSAGKGTVTAFVHAGDDINDSSSWLAGLSYLHTRANNRDTGGDIFSGTDDIGIASLIYKWAPGGNPSQRNLTLSGEYFFGTEEGTFNGVPVNLQRGGWYLQGVYQFMPRWSIGARYAQVNPDAIPVALSGSVLDDFGHLPTAITGLLEFDTSEFGRFRLQYTHDQSDLKPNDEMLLQYTISLGAHGAHRY